MSQPECGKNQGLIQKDVYSTLIAEIYDSVSRPEGFSPFIERACEHLGCLSGDMATINTETGEFIGGWQYGHKQENINLHSDKGFIHQDPLIQTALRAPIGLFIKLRDTINWDEYKELAIYKEWGTKLDLFDMVGTVLASEGKNVTGIAFQRNKHQQLFTQENIELLNKLVPHLQRAASLHLRLLEHGISNHPLKEALNLIKSPTILFDRQGLVSYMNTAAEEFVSDKNWIKIKRQTLEISSSGLKNKFNRLLSKMVVCSFTESGYNGSVIHADMNHDEKIALCLQPMNASTESGKHGGAVLFIHCQSQTIDESKVSMIAELFHITPAEAQVSLLLAQGMSIKLIAELTERKEDTVRTHLKSTFAKTGVNSQGQLVSQILSSPVFIA